VNDIGELTEYVQVHARGQGVREHPAVLDRVRSDGPGGAGTWVGEWCEAARRQEAHGRDLRAARRYALAAFPFIDGPARREAHERCMAALRRWARAQRDVEPAEVTLADGKVRCWATGLADRGHRPLVLVMGGIVTLKEQWAAVLPALRRLGLAGVVTEMPAVGENELSYGPGSASMLSGLLDALAGQADVTRTHVIALSFSGHLALRCAAADRRIRSIITVGAPVGPFFTDRDWQAQLPKITVDTLAHLTASTAGELPAGLDGWALTPAELAALDIDVWYVTSRRDDIIPAGDAHTLAQHVRKLHLVEHDDVHGSPQHVRETQFWTLASLLRSCGGHPAQAAICHGLMRLEQARRRLS
jgi:pimeloyl-ACP methyl ester carboxylesterase